MPISTAEAAIILNEEFVGVTWYVSLRNNGVELSGSGFARVAISDWVSTSDNVMPNPSDFSFPVTSAQFSADEVVLYVASSGGVPRYSGILDLPVTIHSGQARTFPAGELKIKMV